MSKIVQTMILKFSNELRDYEIPAFRGAINQILEKKDILFHNHKEEGFRYSYPLIQYKTIGKKAAIVCIGEGTNEIGELFNCKNKTLLIGDSSVELSLESINAYQTRILFSENKLSYTLRNWLPLNSKNSSEYMAMDSYEERIVYLEKILVGNILSFAKGLNLRIENQINCKITNCSDPKLIKHKGVRMMGFQVEFQINLVLPQYIGLGKASSHGYGILRIKRQTNNN